MKTKILIIAILIQSMLGVSSYAKNTSVKGYSKKDGTYVAPHERTTPDKSKENNWSTKGNVNPNTGKAGTKDPGK